MSRGYPLHYRLCDPIANRPATEFVSGLLSFPLDTGIVAEVVHAHCKTKDSRHFAEEFVKRKRLADQGKSFEGLSSSSAPSSGSGAMGGSGGGADSAKNANNQGGWSEVAKKGGNQSSAHTAAKDESTSNFRVVSGKKKGGRR